MLIFLSSVFATLLYFYYYFKAIYKLQYSAAVLIGIFFPSMAFVLGLETGALLIYLLLITFPLTVKYLLVNDYLSKSTYFGAFALLSVFFLTGWMIFSYTYAPKAGGDYYNEKLLFFSTNILIPSLILILVNKSSNIGEFKYALILVTFCSALIPLFSIIDLGLLAILQNEFFFRLTINDFNPIWFGRFLSYGFIVALFEIKYTFIKSVFSMIFIIAIFFTGSKAALYFTLLALLFYSVYIFVYNYQQKLIVFKLILVFLIVTSPLFILFTNLNEVAFERRFSSSSDTNDIRFELIFEVLESNKYILFGNGLSSSGFALTNSDQRMYPHNIYIEVYYEFGLIGLFVYNIPYLLVFFKVLHTYTRNKKIKDEELVILSLITLSFLFSQTSGDLSSNQYGIVFSIYYLIRD